MKTQKKIKKIVSQVVDSHEISCYYYKGALNRSLVDVLTVKSFDKSAENLHYFLSQKKNHLDVWDYTANQGRRKTRNAYN